MRMRAAIGVLGLLMVVPAPALAAAGNSRIATIRAELVSGGDPAARAALHSLDAAQRRGCWLGLATVAPNRGGLGCLTSLETAVRRLAAVRHGGRRAARQIRGLLSDVARDRYAAVVGARGPKAALRRARRALAAKSYVRSFRILLRARPQPRVTSGRAQVIAGAGPARGASLTIPSGALPRGTLLLISRAPGTAFDISANAKPVKPLTLRIQADRAPADRTLAWWSAGSRSWQPLTTSYDAARREFIAPIRHFTRFGLEPILPIISGSSGKPPSCTRTPPGWVRKVVNTATNRLALAYSCVEGTASGDMRVKVTSNRSAVIVAEFSQKPRLASAEGDFGKVPRLAVYKVDGSWRVYVPPDMTVNVDFSQPASTPQRPVTTVIHGDASRDGATYVADVAIKAMDALAATKALIGPALVKCAPGLADHPEKVSVTDAVRTTERVVQCVIDQGMRDIPSELATQTRKSIETQLRNSKSRLLRALSRASLWLDVASFGRDLLDAYLDANQTPAVVDALVLVRNPPVVSTPRYDPTVVVTPTSGPAGSTLSMSGAGFKPGELVGLNFGGTEEGETRADSRGEFAGASLTVPSDSPLGLRSVRATGRESGSTASAGFTVGPAQAPPPGLATPIELLSVTAGGALLGDRTPNGPVWSPDGTRVAFQGYDDFDLYLKDLRTGTLSRLNEQGDGTRINAVSAPHWSPDGTQVAFYGVGGPLQGQSGFVYVKSLTTGELTIVSRTSAGQVVNGWNPRWSPDGRRILFDGPNISPLVSTLIASYVKDLVSGELTLASSLSDGTPLDSLEYCAVWSPDGTRIMFQLVPFNFPAPADGFQYFVKDLRDGSLTRVSETVDGQPLWLATQPDDYSQACFTELDTPYFGWSPDGTSVLMAASVDTQTETQIYVKNLTTGALTAISTTSDGTLNPYGAAQPTWSPDGTRVAFKWNTTPRPQNSPLRDGRIVVKDLRTGALDVVSKTPNGAPIRGYFYTGNPWSPDSTRLLYGAALSVPPLEYTMQIQDLDSGAVTLPVASALGVHGRYGARTPSWSPDGRKLLFISQSPELAPGFESGLGYGQVFTKTLP